MTQLHSRSDAWKSEEDKKLADIVLGEVRKGNTQLHAFEVAADSLSGRTAQACGFRWNIVLRNRPEYKKALGEAKQKKVAKRKPPVQESRLISVPKEVYEAIGRLKQAGKTYNIAYIERHEKELNRFIRNPETAKDYFTGLQVGFQLKRTPEEEIKHVYETIEGRAFRDGMKFVLEKLERLDVIN